MKAEDVSYLQKGQGKDLVFFHGYLSSKEAFLPFIEYFSKSYRVTAFDFCGFGKSAPLVKPFSVEDYAIWTKEVLDDFGIVKPYCIAHSFGCRVAVKMQALSSGEAFERAVFTGPAGLLKKRTLAYKIKVKTYRAVRKAFPAFAEKRFGSSEYKLLSPIMKESYKKIVNEDLRDDVAKFTPRALVAEGTKDGVITAAEAQEYARLLPKGSLKYIEGGHFAFCENAAEFALMAEEFFSDE